MWQIACHVLNVSMSYVIDESGFWSLVFSHSFSITAPKIKSVKINLWFHLGDRFFLAFLSFCSPFYRDYIHQNRSRVIRFMVVLVWLIWARVAFYRSWRIRMSASAVFPHLNMWQIQIVLSNIIFSAYTLICNKCFSQWPCCEDTSDLCPWGKLAEPQRTTSMSCIWSCVIIRQYFCTLSVSQEFGGRAARVTALIRFVETFSCLLSVMNKTSLSVLFYSLQMHLQSLAHARVLCWCKNSPGECPRVTRLFGLIV